MSKQENLKASFYQNAVNIIFAIIISQSFFLATKVIIPFNNIFETDEIFLKTSALFLAYVVIISGWIGYARSITDKPHKNNRNGVIRFLLDLLILFEFFYLLQLTTNIEYFQNEFHWVMLSLFITFLFWDMVKFFEHKTKRNIKDIQDRRKWTVVFFIICLIITLVYEFIIIQQYTGLEIFENNYSQTFNFIAYMFIISICYRVVKWQQKDKRKSF